MCACIWLKCMECPGQAECVPCYYSWTESRVTSFLTICLQKVFAVYNMSNKMYDTVKHTGYGPAMVINTHTLLWGYYKSAAWWFNSSIEHSHWIIVHMSRSKKIVIDFNVLICFEICLALFLNDNSCCNENQMASSSLLLLHNLWL